jgi:hypothetical protein
MSRRTFVRAGAVAAAALGVVELVAHPGTRTRAEARFGIPAPLVVGDAVGAILTHARGATATNHGRSITVVSSDDNRDVARADARALAVTGLDAAGQRFIATETRRLEAASGDRAQAAAQLATLASRTGLTDPEVAYRERVVALQNLQKQQAVAVAEGQPYASIDAELAGTQQAVFELQLQVTRHTELIQAGTTAKRREIEATGAINAAKRVLGSASVLVSDHATGSGFGIVTGVAALGFAATVLLFSERRSRRAASRKVIAEAAGTAKWESQRDEMTLSESEVAALASCGVHVSRYLEFYRALAPPPVGEHVCPPGSIDLVHEEGVEESGGPALREARERDGSRS